MVIQTSALLMGLIPLSVFAKPQCFGNLQSLRDAKIHTSWQETTADDGKPLHISVLEKKGRLYVDVEKAGESWISGPAEICRDTDEVTVRLQEGMKVGPTVPMVVGMTLRANPQLTMKSRGADQMRISTLAWGGDFQGSSQ